MVEIPRAALAPPVMLSFAFAMRRSQRSVQRSAEVTGAALAPVGHGEGNRAIDDTPDRPAHHPSRRLRRESPRPAVGSERQAHHNGVYVR